MGEEARDWLLEHAGFENVSFGTGGQVAAATPPKRPAVVLSKAWDPNGRPIAYLLVDEDGPADGEWAEVDAELLRRWVNAPSLGGGLA